MVTNYRLIPLPKIGLQDRLRRALWRITAAALFRPSPIAAHRWRCFLLRAFGAQIEGLAYPYPSAIIWAPWNLAMGSGSCIGGMVDCYNVAKVTLGEGVTVSQKSYLCTASHDFDGPEFQLTGAPIVIGPRAWVAADAFIGPGVNIGKDAVILARTVVVRDVEPLAVMCGNPAKFLRQRITTQTTK